MSLTAEAVQIPPSSGDGQLSDRTLAAGQPNELDLRRIQRSLRARARYRYVSPLVIAEAAGYRIVSACCSRNVDLAGGTIDIARISFDGQCGCWCVESKNHATGCWEPQAQGRLHEVLSLLNRDPQRRFWQ